MTAIAQTEQGKLQGTQDNGLSVFRGVRYAQAPLGQLRFRAPQTPESWQGVRSAEDFGPIALQRPNEALDALIGGHPQEQDEDCLYLNIWTPGLDDARRPVMVWIHGGAFTIGSGSEIYYDGSNLASRGDVVVVTINYRLGAFGFLHLPALGETNFGMRDQVAALRWVQRNIASFGGDPDNVLIFGESAGGMSCGSLMASPEASGLFHKAIPQSGAGHHGMAIETAEANGRQFAAFLGVDPDDAETMRSADAADVLAASVQLEDTMFVAMAAGEPPEMPLRPVIDGAFLEAMPIEAIRAGQASGVATLVGNLDEEAKLFGAMVPAEPLTEEDVAARIGFMHPDGQSAYDRYRDARSGRGEDASPDEINDAVQGDYTFRVPTVRLASAQVQHNPSTYVYLFDWKSPGLDGALGSCHALDIPFVFGTHGETPDFAGAGPDADALAEATMDAWLAFARSGDPSSSGVEWPAWNPDEQQITVLGHGVRTESAFRAEEIAIWDGVL